MKHELKILRRSIRRIAIIIFGLLLTVFFSLSRPLATTEPRKCDKAIESIKGFQVTTPPKLYTELNFNNAEGAKKNLADYLGQGIVLNLWATWCLPCVKEMPQLNQLQKKLVNDKIEVLAISVDREGTSLIERFFNTNKINNLEILADNSGKILKKTKTKGLPTTLLINANGREIGRILGVLEWDSENVIDLLRSCLTH